MDIVDVDSEFIKSDCDCSKVPCICDIHTHPIQVHFPMNTDYTILRNIKQKKGEAEMAQIDWLIEYSTLLKEDESCASIVTSGDINSVVLHLFALAHLWPRLHLHSLKFRNDVYVILQKPGGTYYIRQLSIKPSTQTVPRNPQLWMTPASAIRQCLIAYYLTAGRHSAAAPNFLLDGCLMKMKKEDVENDLREEAHTDNIDTCTQIDPKILI